MLIFYLFLYSCYTCSLEVNLFPFFKLWGLSGSTACTQFLCLASGAEGNLGSPVKVGGLVGVDRKTSEDGGQMPEEDLIELKFRLYDGSDIGPFRYSPASTIAMLKERIVAEWPKGFFFLPPYFANFNIFFLVRSQASCNSFQGYV